MIDVDALTFLVRYDQLDRDLVARGWPATSPWWRAEIRRFIQSSRRRWILRVGRRGGKSSTLARLAVAWAVWGAWSVPPGDTAIIPFVSVSRDEAAMRLRTIADILRVIGIPLEQRADEIELIGARRVVFRVVTCSILATVGFSSIMVVGDEVARWESRDLAVNPARHVVATLGPTLATQPHGFMVLSSSPWTRNDFHAECVAAGDTDHQFVSFAESWVANPTLTEEGTHALEPDHEVWAREYAAIPSDAVSANWFGSAIDAAIDRGRTMPDPWCEGIRYVVAIDQAFSRDLFAVAVANHEVGPLLPDGTRGPSVVRLQEIHGWPPAPPRETLVRLRDEVLIRYRTWRLDPTLPLVWCDQHEGSSLVALAKEVGIRMRVCAWTAGDKDPKADPEYRPEWGDPHPAASKMQRFRAERLAMSDGRRRWPDDPALIREARSVRGILTASGSERIEVPRSIAGHGDRLHAAIMASSLAADSRPQLPPARETEIEAHRRRQRERQREYEEQLVWTAI